MAYVEGYSGSVYKSLKDNKNRLIYYYLGILSLSFNYEPNHAQGMKEIKELRRFLEQLGISNYKEYYGALFNYTKKQVEVKNFQTDLFIDYEKYLEKAKQIATKKKSKDLKPIHLLEVMANDNVSFMWPDYIKKQELKKLQPKKEPQVIDKLWFKTLFLDFFDEDKKCNLQVNIVCNSRNILIGRDASSAIRFSEKHHQISSKHAMIACFDGHYYIEDLNSTNGTYVNDVLIGNKTAPKKYVELVHGDIIRLGNKVSVTVSILDMEKLILKECMMCKHQFMTNEDSELCPLCYYEFEKDLMSGRGIKEVSHIPQNFNDVKMQFNACKILNMIPGKLEFIWEKRPYDGNNIDNKNIKKEKEVIAKESDIIPGYEVIKVIGEGGMGKVYLVNERATGKQMALKTIKDDQGISALAKEQFKREASIQQQMNHKYIAKQYDHGEYNGMLYILMEYYKHGTILDYMNQIKKTGKPYDKLKELLIQILQGLDYLHHASLKAKLKNGEFVNVDGIVHRDIKPQNIFIDYDPKGNVIIKIADFGLSKAFEIAGESGMSKTGYAMGTFPFMPRQQIIDSKYSKPEVDIWAAVAIIYYLATGKFPKPINEQDDIVLTCLEEKAVPIKNRNWLFPSKFAKIIDRALDDDCDQLYYQEASDLINDLLKI